MPQFLLIELGFTDPITLRFKLRPTPLTILWVERMQKRHQWPLDHPDRFYGFDNQEKEIDRATSYIQKCISTINSHSQIIQKTFSFDQDCLNYMHNIFERYHGLLDQQNTEYWMSAPAQVRKALADLNLAVHRCESIMANNPARIVCTWYGMPKTQHLDHALQKKYGTMQITFGTVYLNYVEVGKTLEDYAHDDDKYIGDEAFRPFDYYSADFKVTFFDQNLEEKLPAIATYYDQHRDFFVARGIESVYNVQAQPLRFPVADLVDTLSRSVLLSAIAQRQYITQVRLE